MVNEMLNSSEGASEAAAFFCNFHSVVRCTASSFFMVANKTAGTVFNWFAALGGALIIINASRLIKKSIDNLTSAKSKEMKIFYSAIRLPGDYFYLSMGLSMLAVNVTRAAQVALSWAPIFSKMLMRSFLAVSIFRTIEACYGLKITYDLRAILQKSKDFDDVNSDDKNCSYIQMSPFTNDAEDLKKEKLVEREKELIAVLKKLAGKDRQKLEMQTDKACVKKILEFSENPSTDECKALLDQVKKANYDASTCFWFMLGCSVLSAIAASACLAGGGPLLDIIGNIFWAIASLGRIDLDAKELKDEMKKWFWTYHENSENGKYTVREKAEFWTKTALGIITAPVWVVPAFAYYKISSCTQDLKNALLPVFLPAV